MREEVVPCLLAPKLLHLAQGFPVLTLTGPRQSGKSTLVRTVFPQLSYLLLEDPRRFLSLYPDRAIFDEVQRVPELFSYLQSVVDCIPAPAAPYMLTGLQNFLLLESISRTLAGRTAVLKLLPLSYAELAAVAQVPYTLNELVLRAGYPRLSTRS